MNVYLVALIGLVVMLAVGFFFYGLFFKDLIKDVTKPTAGRLIISLAAIYLTALAFCVLYRNTLFAENISNVLRGLYLGLMVGVPFLGLPLLADGAYLKTKNASLWLVAVNWIVSLAIFGLVAGALL